MNKRITVKYALPKTIVSSFTLAATLSFHAGPAHALLSSPFVFDVPHLASTAAGWVKQAVEFKNTLTRYNDQVKDLKADTAGLVDKVKGNIPTTNATNEITIAKIDALVNSPSPATSLSAAAQAYYKEDKACKQGNLSLAGTVLSSLNVDIAGVPAKKQLEQICVMQRELTVMSVQENKNYYALMNGYLKTFEQLKNENGSTSGELGQTSLAITGYNAERFALEAKHNNILNYIKNQQDILAMNQRDIETLLYQGSASSGNAVSNAVKSVLVNQVLSGQTMAVKGNRQTTSYNSGYAN
jgi:hypothetical protein